MSYTEKYPSGTKPFESKANASILKLYSVGEAAANLLVGQTELSVWPKEKQTHADGEVTDNVTTTATSGVDGSGNNYSDNVEASVAIKAKWLSRDPWLKFPGLVRRGEEVMIWRVGDTDQYYWELMGLSNHLRRKDIMLLAISNTRDEKTTDLTAANSVFFELNTVDKHISLSTPNNDGEKCRYMIQLNYGDCNFSLSDDVGNSIVMDSIEQLIQARNGADTFVKLEKFVIEAEAAERISFKTKLFEVEAETINMKGTNGNFEITNTAFTGSKYSMNYSSVTGTCSGTYGINAGSVAFDSGSLEHNGTNVGSSHRHGGIRSGGEYSAGPK